MCGTCYENYIEPTLGSMQYYHCPFGWYDMPGVERGPLDEVIFPWFENTIKDIVFASYRRKRKHSEIELIEDFFYTNNFDYYLNYLKIILPTFEFVSLGIIYSFKYKIDLTFCKHKSFTTNTLISKKYTN